MAAAATPQLAVAVSAAGGLGALGSAVLPPDELRRQAEAVRAATEAPFNVNFFCHPPPQIAPELAERARELLTPLYEENGLGEPPAPSVAPISFDQARLEATLEIRPAVVSFHFGLPDAARGAGDPRRREPGDRLGDHRRRGGAARGARSRRGDRPGLGGRRASRQLPGRRRRRADRNPGARPAGRRCRRRAGDRGGRDRRRPRARRGARARRRRRPDRHRLPRLPGGSRPPGPSRGDSRGRRRGDDDHPRLLRAPGARGPQPRQRRRARRSGDCLSGSALADRPARRGRGAERMLRCGSDRRPGWRPSDRRPSWSRRSSPRPSARSPGSALALDLRAADDRVLAVDSKRTQALLPPS